jgi:uncharacterized protein DUF4124
MKYPTSNVRVMLCLTGSILTSGLLLETAAADTIYKTVDAQGNVTFSNTPPPPGTNAQQIEIQPGGPTPAQRQESEQEEQNLENMAHEMGNGNNTGGQQPQAAPPAQPATEYQQDSGNDGDNGDDQAPVVVDEGYVGDRTRDEVARDRVDDRREVTPGPAGVYHPEERFR